MDSGISIGIDLDSIVPRISLSIKSLVIASALALALALALAGITDAGTPFALLPDFLERTKTKTAITSATAMAKEMANPESIIE
jgi:hypothetical protein